VQRILLSLAPQGIHEDGDSLIAYLPGNSDRALLENALNSSLPGAPVTMELIPEMNWSERWRDAVIAHRVGDIHVCPPWLAAGAAEAPVRIVIDPGMAFGTGEHESTRCALRLLPDWVRSGDRAADLGAGSGILAIAAVLLGAKHVTAIESDPDALQNARENIARNGVDDRILLLEGDAAPLLSLVAPVDLVVANINSSVLVSLLSGTREALPSDGRVVLSGILVDEQSEVEAALDLARFCVLDQSAEGSWLALAAVRL
jgi:ribosomal protein L11 methyltransferase